MKKFMAAQKVESQQERCAMCDEGVAIQTIQVQEFRYGAGRQAALLRAKVPAWHCNTCGESYLDEGGEAAQHVAVCRHLGRLVPTEVLAIRRRLGLAQDRFATEVGVGSASVKRWELGKAIPNHLADMAMRRLAAEKPRAQAPEFQTPITDEIRAAAARFQLRQYEPELMAA